MNDCLCLCHLFKAAAASFEREMGAALAELGVSHCQASVLTNLLAAPLTMSAISRELCCHKSNVTQVVDGLVAKALVERTALPKDKRVSMLALTKKGKTIAEKAQAMLSQRAKTCTDCFTPQEREQLMHLLEKYVDGMKRG